MKFEVYENNGGMITLFVLFENGGAVAAYGNWEHLDGSLKEAIEQLKTDPDAWKTWGGDIGGDIEMPMVQEIAGFEGQPWDERPVYRDREMTLSELYDECATGGVRFERGDDLIAWSTPDGWEYDYSKMGAAGCNALGLDEDDDAE